MHRGGDGCTIYRFMKRSEFYNIDIAWSGQVVDLIFQNQKLEICPPEPTQQQERRRILVFQKLMRLIFNPFTPKSDQIQICPAASPEISHHTVWRT